MQSRSESVTRKLSDEFLFGVIEPEYVVKLDPASADDAGIPVDSSDLTMVPQSTIALDTAEAAKKVLRLIDALDDHDDVQAVHANFDVPDTILETVEAG